MKEDSPYFRYSKSNVKSPETVVTLGVCYAYKIFCSKLGHTRISVHKFVAGLCSNCIVYAQ